MYNHSALNIVNKGYWVIQAFPQMKNKYKLIKANDVKLNLYLIYNRINTK